MRKMYAFGNTKLELSEKAEQFCDNTDPLNIQEREVEDDNGNVTYLYNITGAFEFSDLTAEQVSTCLEELADELAQTEADD